MNFFASTPLLFSLLLIFLHYNITSSLANYDVLYSDQILDTGYSISSVGLTLTMQSDCDLVLRDRNGRVLWNSNTRYHAPNCYLYLTYEGVLEIKSGNTVIWYSDRYGVRDYYILTLMPQGVAVVYGGAGLWYTPLP